MRTTRLKGGGGSNAYSGDTSQAKWGLLLVSHAPSERGPSLSQHTIMTGRCTLPFPTID